MAEATKNERQDGLLWRIARLHPGWVTLIVWLGYFFAGAAQWMVNVEHPPVAVFALGGFMLLYMGYPLFVLLYLPGRFHSGSSPRKKRALAALLAIWVIMGAAMVAGEENPLFEAANAGSVAANFVIMVPLFTAFVAVFYLLIGAALALVEAEKGRSARFARKFGTALQFFYLPLCVWFIHRRVRHLLARESKPDPIVDELPMERLVLAPMKSGHLSLELTEIPNWRSFERYAEELLRRLDGQVIRKGSGVDMHIWSVEIETVPLRLVYEDYPNRICLESDSYPGDMLLRQLHRRLTPSASA